MHPIGQILSVDDQNRGTEHMHALIHVIDAPNIDDHEDSEVVEFIEKYINVLYLMRQNTLK